jgi:tRNA (cmo5U34)-methyltransferase
MVMKEDRIFKSGVITGDFSFNEQVAEVFDNMLSRSVPFYDEVIDSIAGLLRLQARPSSTVYDLGCSTGNTLLALSRRLPDLGLRFVGMDNAPAMIDKARRKAKMFSTSSAVRFMLGDITEAQLPGAGAVILNYTLQFISPPARPGFVHRICGALPEGGTLILSEKVLCADRHLNRLYSDMYHRFKRKQGYSELEIAAKREALENVLIPFSIEENRKLLTQAGFRSVETFFQWYNFASFVAIK